MGTKWTDSQKQAIDSRDGTILVSAAAGSGKTAVLVERVIQRVIDSKKGSKVERILVVTFTKAAAGEMLERISDRLTDEIAANPNDSFLKRQKTFLPNANICTMDSFCGQILKENFQNADILPDFKMMSNSEHELLKKETLKEILQDVYNEESTNAKALLELFTNSRNDEDLMDAILNIYDFSMSAPNPKKWIDEQFNVYFEDTTLENSIWGKYCLERLEKILQYMLVKIEKILHDAGDDNKVGNVAKKSFEQAELDIKKALDLIKEDNKWDEIKAIVDGLKLKPFGKFSDEEKDSLYSEIKDRTDAITADFKQAQKTLSCYTAEFYDDIEYLKPIISLFKDCIIKFSDLLLQKKKEKNTYYFADILHFTLDLLVTEDENGVMVKTPLAIELSEKYDEILIDEFQDTNEAQDYLFNAISRNSENKFMVGDVKQSIYRFRQAEPQIFISYKDKFADFNGNNYPAKISLDKNFRSREGIIDGINFFFDLLMTRKMGDVDYKNGEQLVYGADYSESDNADVHVHVLESDDAKKSNFKNEIKYVGKLIKETIDSGMLVGKKGSEHPVSYGDICILMRSVKDKACELARGLEEMGIPTYYRKDGGFFDNAEIMTVMSLLNVIDNPVQDVPLISVMLSPMFSFTEDDLARMRCNDRKNSFYVILKNSYETDAKVKHFIDVISNLRMLSVTLSISELIRRAFEITAYDSVVGAMANGEKRALNLQLFMSYADAFEKNGGHGLSGFVRYVEKMRKNDCDIEDASTSTENSDVVEISTIHKSKGLEYPIVIIANCSSDMHGGKDKKAVADKEMGVALLRYDRENHKEFQTQPFVAIKLKNKIEEMSESMRILYVAMTRAKEKLHIVGSLYKPETAIKNIYSRFYMDAEDNPVALSFCNSFLQWILVCLIRHPSLAKQIKGYGILNSKPVLTNSKISLDIIPNGMELLENETSAESSAVADKALLSDIEKKVAYEYPYKELSDVAIKYSASSMNKDVDTRYIATESPAFMGKDELTPAQRGTLIHRFMEKCNILSLANNVADEFRRLVDEGVFTETEAKAVDLSKIEKFVSSDMYNRIVNAENFLREKEFTMRLPLSVVNDNFKTVENEKVIVQGMMDGIIINGNSGEIIDYKTDRVISEDELIERYSDQMKAYKIAAKECLGIDDVKVTLYSFALSKEISLKL